MRCSVFFAAVLALAGCNNNTSTDSGPGPGSDGGTDAFVAPTVDSGTDTGPIATVDGGHDTGPSAVDANVDAHMGAMECADGFAGCTVATATNDTASSTVTISAAGAAGTYHYDTPCIRIHTGTMVTITNTATLHPLHSATCSPSDSPIAAAPTGTTFTFAHAGRYGYYCGFHGTDTGTGMAGMIIVE